MHMEIISKHIATYTVAWIPMPHGSDTSLCLGFFNLYTSQMNGQRSGGGTTEQHGTAWNSMEQHGTAKKQSMSMMLKTSSSSAWHNWGWIQLWSAPVYLNLSDWNLNLKHFEASHSAHWCKLYLSVVSLLHLPVPRCATGSHSAEMRRRCAGLYIHVHTGPYML